MKLKILKSADDKIRVFTALCPDEISGLGKVSVVDGVLTVSDVAIFNQTVSGAHSTIDTVELAKFQTEIVKAGGSMKEWCLWWHSHAAMGVFFSGTDTGTIDESTEFPWLVSLVVNKKGESKARVDVYTPVRMFMELDVEVEEPELSDRVKKAREALSKALDEEIKHVEELCQKEIDKKVRVRSEIMTRETRNTTSLWTERYENILIKEYWSEKMDLIRQIAFLKTGGKSKEEALSVRMDELEELTIYGRTMGYEVRSNSME